MGLWILRMLGMSSVKILPQEVKEVKAATGLIWMSYRLFIQLSLVFPTSGTASRSFELVFYRVSAGLNLLKY